MCAVSRDTRGQVYTRPLSHVVDPRSCTRRVARDTGRDIVTKLKLEIKVKILTKQSVLFKVFLVSLFFAIKFVVRYE